MPSTLVHMGVAGLIGAALLGDHFDGRAIAIVLLAAAIPDLDTFIGLWLVPGGHRTVLHNVIVPATLLALVVWDTRFRANSAIKTRWGEYGVRVAWVSLLGGWILAHVMMDAFYNGVNLFWPLYDQFIDLSGQISISDQRGLIFTIIEFESGPDGLAITDDHARGTADELHYYTGVDPGPDRPATTERWFPIATTGERLLLLVTGFGAVLFRLWETHDAEK